MTTSKSETGDRHLQPIASRQVRQSFTLGWFYYFSTIVYYSLSVLWVFCYAYLGALCYLFGGIYFHVKRICYHGQSNVLRRVYAVYCIVVGCSHLGNGERERGIWYHVHTVKYETPRVVSAACACITSSCRSTSTRRTTWNWTCVKESAFLEQLDAMIAERAISHTVQSQRILDTGAPR